MKPESLKQLAEYMGYEVTKSFNFIPEKNTVYVGRCEYPTHNASIYNPLTNTEQCLELMEKLKINLEHNGQLNRWESFITPAAEYWFAETINEAVTNAAIAAIKE